MTNETNYIPSRYNGNGVTKDFAFNWKVDKTNNLVVKLINSQNVEEILQQGVDYTAVIKESQGNVTLTTALQTGEVLVIERNTPQYQSTKYSTSPGFQGSELERSFDKVSLNLQEMEYDIETFKTDFSDEVNQKISNFEQETNQKITDLSDDVTEQIEALETETNQQISDFKDEVNTKIQEVSDAAEKINELEEAVEEAQQSAQQAEQKATEATTQAGLAQQAAQTAENAADEAAEIVESKADISFSNITEEAKAVIRQTAGTGLPIGSLVAVDRVLSFAESKGLAQLGSYVYKDAVPGSRYGYPDFYNDCVEKLSSADNVNISVAVNVHNTGCVIDSNFIVSGFSSRNFIQPTSGFYPSYYDGQPFEVGVKLNTTTMTGMQSFLGGCDSHDFYGIVTQFQNNKLRIGSTNNGTSWNLINLAEGTKTYDINTDYWFKLEYTGTQYIASWSTDGQTYTPDITVDQSVAPAIRSFCLGNNLYGASQQEPLQGTIDIKECYIKINNELVWQGTQNFIKNTNGHILYDISQKPTADYLYNTYGACWAYGVDTENERIFLPRNDWFFQSGNAENVGKFNEAGLPNITGNVETQGYAGSQNAGALYSVGTGNRAYAGGQDGRATQLVYIDASRCQDIYGKSNTVQPPSVNQIVYMVVGNTEVESAATDIVDVTTTENDTIPLFTGMYYDFKPNNSSWLKAGEQANNGGLYSSAYSKLVNELTSPVYNLKVIDVSDMESNVDYSEYWKVDQDAQTFTTPTRLSHKALTGGVVGNGIAIGLTDGTNNGGLIGEIPTGGGATYGVPFQSGYGQSVGQNISRTGSLNNNTTIGLTTDSTKSGIKAEESTSQLYFKVMNAVENQDLINLGEITEALADKVDPQQVIGYAAPDFNNAIWNIFGASGTIVPARDINTNTGSYLEYTAPDDGWVYFYAENNGAWPGALYCLTEVISGNSELNNEAHIAVSGNTVSNGNFFCYAAIVPAKKGAKFRLSVEQGTTLNQTGRLLSSCFCYSKGQV